MMMDSDITASSAEGVDPDTSTHMSTRISTRTQRIEVITRGERRRRWTPEQKQAIVAESVSAATSITAVAQKHGIGTGLLYTWRHQLLTRRSDTVARFAQVELLSEPSRLTGPVAAPSDKPPGLIEIALPGGASIRVDAQVDEPALRRVLAALDRR
jgi:transposase